MIFTRTLFTFLLITLFTSLHASPPSAVSSHDDETPSVFDSFYSEKMLTFTLETDLDALINHRKREDFQNATLTYKDEQGQSREWDIQVKPRGKFRRRICDFPPVKLKFHKKTLEENGLNEHNDLKLVSHCLDEYGEGNENLVREFLAYKLYNILNPNSFRVQIIKIQYRDTEGFHDPIRRYGFIIEDVDEMAERTGGVECDDCMNPKQEMFNLKAENMASVFQYMIGNADWSHMLSRNVKYIKQPSGKLLPVPYDFDFSGMVSAAYALPNRDYGLEHVQHRAYLGLKPDKEILLQTLEVFRDKKSELLMEVKKCKWLSRAGRSFIKSYLNDFFDLIETGTEAEIVSLFTPAKMDIPLKKADDIGASGG